MKTRTSLVLIAFLMFAGFQNCSKVNFAASEDAMNKSAGLEDGDFPVNEPLDPGLVGSGTDVIADEDDVPEVPGDGAGGTDPGAGEEVVKNEDEDILDDDDGDGAETNCEAFAADSSGGITGVDVRIRKFRGDLKVSASQTLEISNTRGSVLAKTLDAKHLRNMRGGLCLIAESLDHLNNHRGNLEIIGAVSKSINNTRGTMIINGGSVERISNHRGNIILKGGATVGSIDNHRGNVSTVP